MTIPIPQFVSLRPEVLDENRVTLYLETTNFPQKPNVSFAINTEPSKTTLANVEDLPDVNPNEVLMDSPYPNVELSILNQAGVEVASTFIVEHQETNIALTLYIRQPHAGADYIAIAQMLGQRGPVAEIRTPFVLQTPPTPNTSSPKAENG